MKKILILILLFIGNLSFAQNEGVIEHYNQMISLLNLYSNNLENAAKHYQSADQSLVSYKKHNKGVVSMLNAESSNDSQIKTLEDFAGCVADDLVGWNERKDGEVKRHPGIFAASEISRAQADEMIMAARLAAGWVTEEDLREPEPERERQRWWCRHRQRHRSSLRPL